MNDFPDGHLVEQAKKGNIDAFTELARRYQERIYQTILWLTRNNLDADDLAQETFMHAFKCIKDFKQRSGFYTWIYRIAVNLTLNFLKKRNREKNKKEALLENFNIEKNPEKANLSPEKQSLRKELRKKLNEAVDSLPLHYRASFILVVFQGMTHYQASQVLRCSENTVSWRMHKARKMLQVKLLPYLEGDGI